MAVSVSRAFRDIMIRFRWEPTIASAVYAAVWGNDDANMPHDVRTCLELIGVLPD
jgi:hypothetical protein